MRTRTDTIPRRIQRPGMFAGGDGSTLSLDFTAMSSLDTRFIFTRSTTATFINSQGYVQFDDHNLVRNSTFTSLTGWASTGSGTTTNAGGVLTLSTSAVQTQLYYAQTNANGFQDNSPMSGRVYSASIQVSGISGGMSYQELITVGGSISSGVHYLNGTTVSSSATAENGLITFVWTSGGANTLRIGIGASGSTTYPSASVSMTLPRCVIGSQVQPTYIESPVSSTYHGPRFDYDSTTLVARGLLIEAAATNYAVSSEAFSTSYWGNTGLSGGAPTATSQTNPQNTASSVQFVEDTSTGAHGAYQIVSGLTAGTVYTLSAWVKSDGTRNFASLRLTVSGGNPSFSAVWSLTDGTPGNTLSTGSPTSTARSIAAYPDGWYRIQISMACPATFTAMLGYVNGSNTNTLTNQPQSYTGTATKGIYVWGAQFEVGGGATSYIPTGASTVQRTADSCAIALSSFGFNTSAGTLFADWYRKNSDSGSQGGGPWSTDYASARWLGVQNAIASNTVSLSSWSGSTNIANGATLNKAAATYGAWTGSVVPTTFCVNNSAVTSANRDFNPSTATYLTIGAASSSAATSPAYGVATRDWLNNSIRSIKYWPSILPDATLQSITA